MSIRKALTLGALTVTLFASPSLAHATTITFSEPIITGLIGFNGQINERRLSTDGDYIVETFALNSLGHFHESFLCGDLLNPCERNHNQAAGTNNLATLQGIRIARVDSQAFTLIGMDIFSIGQTTGQAAIGQLANASTGEGTWALYTAGAINFGSTFANVNQIFIADPFAAGGSTGFNGWDNIELSAASVPDVSPSALLMAIGALASAVAHRRWRSR